MNTAWLNNAPKKLNQMAADAAGAHQAELTKPAGSLGELENIAVFLASAQANNRPCADALWISIFAGDHGVVAEGISAYPQAVTAEMIKNFSRGGAAICVLAKTLQAQLEVIDLGTVMALKEIPGVTHLNLGLGTANFTQAAAMSAEQCASALNAGKHSVEQAIKAGAQLYIGGEMGIGNTTSAAALSCALLGDAPEQLAGPGTGLDAQGVSQKAVVIAKALALHAEHCLNNPLEALRRLGGFEIAALTGAYLTCAQLGLPVIVDGFISSSAALAAERILPGAKNWFLYGHCSAETGHARLLQALSAKPLLKLGLRLGEGSGAASAVPLIRLACALHNDMASFASAAVSGRKGD